MNGFPNLFSLIRRRNKPLLYLPKSSAAARAALELFPAQTLTARLLKGALHLMLGLKITPPLECTELQITRGLRDWLDSLECASFAVLAGNPSTDHQRFLYLLFNKKEEPMLVAKVGFSPKAKELVIREARFLGALQEHNVPKCVSWIEQNEVTAFAMPLLKGDSPKGNQEVAIGALLSSWVEKGAEVALGDLAQWQALRAAGMPADIGGVRVRPVLSHGDFAPWNIKVDKQGKWHVLDWERGELRGVPGWDWFHYLVQTELLVKKSAPRKVLARCKALLASEAFKSYARLCLIEGICPQLLHAYLVYALEVLRPTEGTEALRALVEEAREHV